MSVCGMEHDEARYFITYMLDSTLGVAFNFAFLTLFELLFDRLGQRVMRNE